MSSTSLTMQIGVLMIVISLCHIVLAEDSFSNKQKRGFRLNASSRVAHGYGKRDYVNPMSNEQLARLSLRQLRQSPGFEDYTDEGTIMTVEEFAQLLRAHPSLARAILKKFIDVNADGVISTDELFRPVMKK